MTYHTHAEYVYSHIWWSSNVSTSAVVYLKACSDAHIALARSVDDIQNAYEVVIGGWHNTQSVIRDTPMGSFMAQADTTGILSCNMYIPIWLSWEGSHIEVGVGLEVGTNVILSWQNPSAHWQVQAVGVSTGFDYEGDWSFLPGQGEAI